jgi:hypothetical protein
MLISISKLYFHKPEMPPGIARCPLGVNFDSQLRSTARFNIKSVGGRGGRDWKGEKLVKIYKICYMGKMSSRDLLYNILPRVFVRVSDTRKLLKE